MYSWGYGEEGQLGHGSTDDSLKPREIEFFPNNGIQAAFIAAGHSHSGVISEASSDMASAQLFMWGAN